MLVWLTGAVAAAAAAAACLRASRLASPRGARAWRMQSSAAVAWVAYGLLRAVGAPDLVATVAWCAFALLVGRGMWLTSRSADVRGRTRMLLDAVTASASTLVVAWTVAAGPAWVQAGLQPADAGLLLRPAVAVGLCVLYVLVLLAEIRPGHRAMPVLLVCSVAATAAAEAAWSWARLGGSVAAVWPHVGFVVASALMLAAAVVYRGTTTRLERPPTSSRLIALAPFVLLVPPGVVLLSLGLGGGHLGAVQGWGAAALVVVVLLRQVVTGAENRDLVHRLWRSEERLRHQATHDQLTGLPNRVLLTERLRAVVASPRPGGLLVLDLDGFKQVNDRWGHAAGDELLRQAADRLRSAARADDLPARLGGDEFAVVVADGEAVALAGRVRAAMSAPFVLDGRAVHGVSASIGVAGTRAQGHDPHARDPRAQAQAQDAGTHAPDPRVGRAVEQLLHRADTAMYAAKRDGGGLVVVADDRVVTGPEASPRPAGA